MCTTAHRSAPHRDCHHGERQACAGTATARRWPAWPSTQRAPQLTLVEQLNVKGARGDSTNEQVRPRSSDRAARVLPAACRAGCRGGAGGLAASTGQCLHHWGAGGEARGPLPVLPRLMCSLMHLKHPPRRRRGAWLTSSFTTCGPRAAAPGCSSRVRCWRQGAGPAWAALRLACSARVPPCCPCCDLTCLLCPLRPLHLLSPLCRRPGGLSAAGAGGGGVQVGLLTQC